MKSDTKNSKMLPLIEMYLKTFPVTYKKNVIGASKIYIKTYA